MEKIILIKLIGSTGLGKGRKQEKTGTRIPLTGEKKWIVSQHKLCSFIKYLCSGYTIEEEKRFDWLNNQRIDIYITELKVAIERDGRQHMHMTKFFHNGQLDSFLQQQERDQRKERLCKENGIKIIRWGHTEPVDDEGYIIKKLQENGIKTNQDVLSF